LRGLWTKEGSAGGDEEFARERIFKPANEPAKLAAFVNFAKTPGWGNSKTAGPHEFWTIPEALARPRSASTRSLIINSRPTGILIEKSVKVPETE
jgi:hypothetical protein